MLRDISMARISRPPLGTGFRAAGVRRLRPAETAAVPGGCARTAPRRAKAAQAERSSSTCSASTTAGPSPSRHSVSRTSPRWALETGPDRQDRPLAKRHAVAAPAAQLIGNSVGERSGSKRPTASATTRISTAISSAPMASSPRLADRDLIFPRQLRRGSALAALSSKFPVQGCTHSRIISRFYGRPMASSTGLDGWFRVIGHPLRETRRMSARCHEAPPVCRASGDPVSTAPKPFASSNSALVAKTIPRVTFVAPSISSKDAQASACFGPFSPHSSA